MTPKIYPSPGPTLYPSQDSLPCYFIALPVCSLGTSVNMVTSKSSSDCPRLENVLKL